MEHVSEYLSIQGTLKQNDVNLSDNLIKKLLSHLLSENYKYIIQ